MIIGIAGKTASGKTTIAEMLEEKVGAVRIRYSGILSEMAKERGLDPTDKATLQNIFLTQRETRGEEFLTNEMETRVAKLTAPIIVIEGNRRIVDIVTLKRIADAKQDKLLLLFIDASLETRFTRYNNRLVETGHNKISKDAFLELENNPAENEIENLKTVFTAEGLCIDANTKTPEEVFKGVSQLLRY